MTREHRKTAGRVRAEALVADLEAELQIILQSANLTRAMPTTIAIIERELRYRRQRLERDS